MSLALLQRAGFLDQSKKKWKVYFPKEADAEPLRKWHTKICLSEWIRFKFLSWKDNETNVWYRVGGSAKHENLASNKVIRSNFHHKKITKLTLSLALGSSTSENEDEYEFCSREVWYFVFFVLELENNQFRVLYAAYLRVFKGKKFWDDALDEEDVKIIFDLWKSRFRGDDFSSKFRCRRAVGDEFLACVTSHGLLKIRTKTKQTNSYLSSFSFSDLKLSIFLRHFAPIQTSVPNDVLSSEKAAVFSSYPLLTWWHRTYQQGQGTGLGKRQRTQKTPSIHPNELRSLILVARALLFSASCTRLDRSL